MAGRLRDELASPRRGEHEMKLAVNVALLSPQQSAGFRLLLVRMLVPAPFGACSGVQGLEAALSASVFAAVSAAFSALVGQLLGCS